MAIIESDVGLVIGLLRLCGRRAASADRPANVRAAIERLSEHELSTLGPGLPAFTLLPAAFASEGHVAFWLHAVATQRAADRLALELDYPDRGELLMTALLHDIGKLVLQQPPFEERLAPLRGPPEERLRSERRKFGVDHAQLGGKLARHWDLPERLARAIESHHEPDAEAESALTRLADMLAHYQHGQPIDPTEVCKAGLAVGVGREQLGTLLYDLSYGVASPDRDAGSCPLSVRELQVLKRLSDGKVYKQIAVELDLAVNTVRSHLHHIYTKLDVVDRAQAVLLAKKRGWL